MVNELLQNENLFEIDTIAKGMSELCPKVVLFVPVDDSM